MFGCTKFHEYIYGVPNVKVESDHKPLETILKKPLYQAPVRLQKMIMTVQKYSIDVVYHPGKYLVIADTLSEPFYQSHLMILWKQSLKSMLFQQYQFLKQSGVN